MEHMAGVVGVLVPIAGIAFVTIAVWLAEQRKTQESLHRTELLRKIAESPGDASQKVLEMIHQHEREAQIRRREGLKLGGLITLAAGIGLAIFLLMIVPIKPVWTVGLIPLLIGAALFIYVQYFSSKPE